jgi:hypothetical protein
MHLYILSGDVANIMLCSCLASLGAYLRGGERVRGGGDKVGGRAHAREHLESKRKVNHGTAHRTPAYGDTELSTSATGRRQGRGYFPGFRNRAHAGASAYAV